jgi:IclR family KDG regulon transcriptional repressor
LANVAKDGIAIEEDQTDLGVACIAAPIFDRDGVVAAMRLSSPTVRLQAAKLDPWRQLVHDGANAISLKLHKEST